MRRFSSRLWSWAIYDFANTIFSAVVVTAYFPLYFTRLVGNNWTLGLGSTLMMVAAGLVVPFLGALSDRTGRTRRYLIYTTVLCVFFLLGLSSLHRPLFALVFFLISTFFFHASLVFYNALLPAAAETHDQGFASGLGTGLGYLGVLFALPLAHWTENHLGTPFVFMFAGITFLLFSFPTFFFVPERKVQNPEPFCWAFAKEEWSRTLSLIKTLPGRPALGLFLLGNFFVVDALNSTILWFLVYARQVYDPGQEALVRLLMIVNGSAFLFGCGCGILTEKYGSMKILIVSSLLLAASLFGIIFATGYSVFVALAATGGSFAFAGIWTAGRKAVLEFCREEEAGSYFGLYGLTTKISVIGSLIFSVLADFAGYQIALGALAIPAVGGAFLLILSAEKKIKKPI